MTEYYSIQLDISTDEELDRVLKLARSMPSYYRIYIDDQPERVWAMDQQYCVEVLVADEQDVTMFKLKL